VRKGRRFRKPLNALTTLGTAAHHGFERWAGVGVFLEPWLGRRATNVFWSVAMPAGIFRALFGDERDDPVLALSSGMGLAGGIVHLVDWPWSLRWGLLPLLDEAEGLTERQLPFYNAILWTWMLAGAGALALETAPEHRKFAAAGLATGPLLLISARHHFRWAAEQAEREPERWSPALRRAEPVAA
jgi:hypothetical protein